jgi:hypothetical protein
MAKGDLWVAVQPGSIGVGADDYVMLNVGDVAEDGHPVMAGRDAMFQLLPIRFRLGDGQAEAVEPAPPADSKPKAQRGSQAAQEPSGTSGQAEGKGEAGKPGSGSGAASVGLTSDDAPGARRSK